MSEFDDPELERLLGRAGGKYPDVNVAYERMLGRVRQARRRRTVVVSGAACGLLFFVAALAAVRTDDSSKIQPADGATIDGSFDASRPDSVPESSTGDTTSTDITTSNSTTNGGGTSGSGTTTPATANSSPPTSAPPSPVTEVFSGQGGSITVRLENGTLELVSVDAAEGFSAEVQETGDDRVEVRFESETHRTDIRVDLEAGAMAPSIEESDTDEEGDGTETTDGGDD